MSDRAFDVSAALERELRRLGVRWVRDRAVELLVEDGVLAGVLGDRGAYRAGRVAFPRRSLGSRRTTAAPRSAAAMAAIIPAGPPPMTWWPSPTAPCRPSTSLRPPSFWPAVT